MTNRRNKQANVDTKASGSARQWTIALVVGVIGLLGAVLAAGPDTVVERTRATFGSYSPPEILRVQPKDMRANGAYVVTLSNPSFEEVALLGYQVEPVASFAAAAHNTNAGGGEVSRVVAEDAPAKCKAGKRDVSLGRTIAVQPKKTMELEIHPWTLNEYCSFELRFQTSHGDSTTIAVWRFDVRRMKYLQNPDLPVPSARPTKTCPDGSVMLAADSCPASLIEAR